MRGGRTAADPPPRLTYWVSMPVTLAMADWSICMLFVLDWEVGGEEDFARVGAGERRRDQLERRALNLWRELVERDCERNSSARDVLRDAFTCWNLRHLNAL